MAKNMAVFDEDRLDTRRLLQVLTAVRKGDFSVRLPSNWAGIDGKIADSLNDIIEMMSDSTKEIERVSRVVGREGKLSQRSEEHTSELQSQSNLVCRLLLEKKNKK